MAGSNNLYLEPIINGAVGDMGANISAMNTQLSETTRILMNILNNQGLQQHQEVYNDATFSALTLTGDTTTSFNASFTGTATIVNSNTVSFTNTGKLEIITEDSNNCNFTNVSSVTVTMTAGNGVANFDKLVLTDDEGNIETITGTISGTVSTFAISEEQRKQYKNITFNKNWYGYAAPTFVIVYTGGTFEFKEKAAPGFNANNILTWTKTNAALNPLYTETKTVYITIPDIQNVSTWVSAVLKGNLDGVSIALVDNSTHEIITLLPTATSDLSDVSIFTGLALMVTFAGDGNAAKYLSGFTMRYY